MFRRRVPRQSWRRLREVLWPENGLWRAIVYRAKRLLRLRGSPHALAAGIAAGTFASFTPLVGFHFFMAAAVAYALRGNLIASAVGTAVGNPLTFPFFWYASFKVGSFVIGHPPGTSPNRFIRTANFDHLWPVLEPLLLGSVILGTLAGIVVYFPTRWAIARWQHARQQRLAARLARPAATATAVPDKE